MIILENMTAKFYNDTWYLTEKSGMRTENLNNVSLKAITIFFTTLKRFGFHRLI